MVKPPSSRKQEIVGSLLDAAEPLIAERGTHGFSLRDVAQRAGLQHSLISRHIGKKRDLIDAVYRRVQQRIGQRIQCTTQLAEVLDAIASDPMEARLLVHMALERSSVALATIFASFNTALPQIVEAQARGQIVKNLPPEVIHTLIMAFGLGWLLIEPSLPGLMKRHQQNASELRKWVADLGVGLLEERFQRSTTTRA